MRNIAIVLACAFVLILKLRLCPALTLMSVEKPWMVGSPEPSTVHTDESVPGKQFSASIGFAGAEQDACAVFECAAMTNSASIHGRTPAHALPTLLTFMLIAFVSGDTGAAHCACLDARPQ